VGVLEESVGILVRSVLRSWCALGPWLVREGVWVEEGRRLPHLHPTTHRHPPKNPPPPIGALRCAGLTALAVIPQIER